MISRNENKYNWYIQSYMKKGLSYPTALSKSLVHFINENCSVDLTLPNNILGFHYIKAIVEQHSSIEPHTVKRKQAQFHEREISLNRNIASATSIRQLLVTDSQSLDQIRHVVPNTTVSHLQEHLQNFHYFQDWERLFPFFKYKVLTSSAKYLSTIYEAEEGLENRILKFINEAESFSSFIQKIKTKRYTWTRLQRLCLHILTNTTKEEMNAVGLKCPYIRILGMNEKGRNFIHQKKKSIPVPLVTTVSKHNHPVIDIEHRAARCYSLGFSPSIQNKLMIQEYAHPPIIVK